MAADRRPSDRLNLSRRPFVNNRPVTRAAVLLWALGALLLLVNVLSFWSYLESSREKRAEVKTRQAQIATERAALAAREERVSRLDLVRQNDEVYYLNGKIAQRTFSWSRLLNRIAEVLPDDIRLQRLSPRGIADEREDRQVRRAGNRRTPPADRVTLTIDGEAKTDEAILELVDNLFGHPAFVEPNLTRESRDKGGYIRFDVTVGYLPNAVVAAGVVTPSHRRKLAPELPPEPIQPANAGAAGARPPAAPRPPAGVPQPADTFAAPVVRTAPPPVRIPAGGFNRAPRAVPQAPDPLRGVGSPTRPRTPPPYEGGRR